MYTLKYTLNALLILDKRACKIDENTSGTEIFWKVPVAQVERVLENKMW